MKNQVMLITYPDSFGRNLKEVKEMVDTYFKEEINSIHILPFYPSSGDRGFAPIDYSRVSEEFGTWDDIEALGSEYELMFDFMINHLSRRSPQFRDFLQKHDASKYADMFLRFKKFWSNGEPTKEQVDLLNKRKPCVPCEVVQFADGTEEKIWCTFDSEQMDLDLRSQVTWDYVEETLKSLIRHGAAQIRLDAFAFATKKENTSCFFLEPEIWEMMARIQSILDESGTPMLPEIHSHYTIQQKIADHGYAVYDFVLPVMVLHTLYAKESGRLKHWLAICPRRQQTTLDTHDGIGTIDVEGLLSQEELDQVIAQTEKYGANFKWHYTSDTIGKQVVYQINCTYYSAVGEDDNRYLLARAIQFFTPGIPQVYYVGLLAGENDYELMNRTNYPRNISRHNYTMDEIREQVKKPVVQKLKKLMRFRNGYPAFDGELVIEPTDNSCLYLTWIKDQWKTSLKADLNTEAFMVTYLDETGSEQILALD